MYRVCLMDSMKISLCKYTKYDQKQPIFASFPIFNCCTITNDNCCWMLLTFWIMREMHRTVVGSFMKSWEIVIKNIGWCIIQMLHFLFKIKQKTQQGTFLKMSCLGKTERATFLKMSYFVVSQKFKVIRNSVYGDRKWENLSIFLHIMLKRFQFTHTYMSQRWACHACH